MKHLIVFIAAMLCSLPIVEALASCGSAVCPLNTHRYQQAGQLTVEFVHEYINQDQIYVGSQRSYVGAIRHHHDEVQTINERNIVKLQAGISDRWGVNLEIPFISRQHSHIHHHHGEDLWESWNFSGLGDVVIGGQYSVLIPRESFKPSLSFFAAVKLPSGITDLRNEFGDEAEIAIQPGSGSTDGIVGVNYRQSLVSVPLISGSHGSLPVIAGGSYQFNGKGKDDWRFGNLLLVHLGTAYPVTPRIKFLFQLNGRFQDFADVGSTGEPRENTGGTWIYTSPGLSLQLIEEIAGFAFIQFPVYQNVHGIQQTSKFNLQFGVSAHIGLLE